MVEAGHLACVIGQDSLAAIGIGDADQFVGDAVTVSIRVGKRGCVSIRVGDTG
jgi:hypothetical protein